MRVNRRLRLRQDFLLSYINTLPLLAVTGCALLSPTTKSTTYNEDLSSQRPRVEAIAQVDSIQVEEKPEDVVPTHDQTAEIDTKLQAITTQNRTSRTAAGFTIQVYSGTSREQASQAKARVYKIIPDARPETKYEQPIYKVRVGEFGDRLAAQDLYAELVGNFPDAIVIPSRIRLN